MPVDLFCSQPHYWAHLAPVWGELGRRGLAGAAWSSKRNAPWGTPLGDRDGARPVLVAGFVDHQAMAPAATILLEHGSGQSYAGVDLGNYAGGAGWERCVLFLCPGEQVAQRWRAAYDTPAVAVGCPFLDHWHESSQSRNRESATNVAYESIEGREADTTQRTVAVTFHWDAAVSPESRSALRHYAPELPRLVRWARANKIRLLGHGHPRAWPRLERLWRQVRIEPVREFAEILDRADLLVLDNSSVGPEFASTGRPVCWLNAPWYRRDVSHGGRFWDWPAGQVQCDRREDLIPSIEASLADPPDVVEARRAMVESVYVATDGEAGWRAADAIAQILDRPRRSHDPTPPDPVPVAARRVP